MKNVCFNLIDEFDDEDSEEIDYKRRVRKDEAHFDKLDLFQTL